MPPLSQYKRNIATHRTACLGWSPPLASGEAHRLPRSRLFPCLGAGLVFFKEYTFYSYKNTDLFLQEYLDYSYKNNANILIKIIVYSYKNNEHILVRIWGEHRGKGRASLEAVHGPHPRQAVGLTRGRRSEGRVWSGEMGSREEGSRERGRRLER